MQPLFHASWVRAMVIMTPTAPTTERLALQPYWPVWKPSVLSQWALTMAATFSTILPRQLSRGMQR